VSKGLAITLILGLILLTVSYPCLTQSPAPTRALILYDGPSTGYSEGLISANSIANLLGHFSVGFQIQPLESYQRGSLENYGWIFFAGNVEKTQIPKAFLDDLLSTTKTVCWLNRHINQLTRISDFRQKSGFSFIDYRDDEEFDSVLYKGISLRKSDPDLNLIGIENRSRCRVWAQAKNDAGIQPYIVQSGNFWYVADSPFSFVEEGDRYLAFCDILHEILNIPHQTERNALVRIEDVSIDDDPVELRRIADYLSSQRVPFQIALIPIFKDPSKGTEVYLSDRPQFVEALKYMVGRGGTVVLHGVTHQFRGTSADDFEFWDDLRDKPVSFDSVEMVRKRLELGLNECFKNGLYPLAWETPHYAASALDNQVFREFFSHVNERRMVIGKLGTQQYFPYPLTDIFGQEILPENLGFVSIDNPQPGRLVEDSQKMLTVRDGMPSFFFHSFMKLDYLKLIIQGVKQNGYHFVSLKSFGCQTRTHNRVAQTVSGPVRLNLDREFLRFALLDGQEIVQEETVSSALISGPVERDIPLSSGQMAVMEGLTEKPEIRKISWYEQWRKTLFNRFSPWEENGKKDPKFVSDATLLWSETQDLEQSNDQESFRSALKAFGIRTRILSAERLVQEAKSLSEIVFIPYPSGLLLSQEAQQAIFDHVKAGGKVILDGKTELSQKLGIKFEGRKLPVDFASDVNFPDVSLEWKPTAYYPKFTPPKGYQQLFLDSESRSPLGLMNRLGKGDYLFLGPLFDPYSRLGTNRYPYLFHTLRTNFNLRALARRPQLEVYFDPGLRAGVSLERLVRSWRSFGVKIVYAAAWATSYRQWDFNYDYFIDLCHKNGILVYAWFELPYINEKFWDAHPQWRERTATGADGHVGWRLLMNLSNEGCRRAAFKYVRDLLDRFPWDGVNIAELNYDTDQGPLNPAKYVPMNDDVRRAFQTTARFDPVQLFDNGSAYFWKKNPAAFEQFCQFRSQMITSWHREILELLTPICLKKDLELVITMLDSLHSQTLKRDTGVDSEQILSLMEKYPFTLQVEDPAEFWTQSPDRYSTFVKTYLKRVRNRKRLVFDLNVIPNRVAKNSQLPTGLQTGTELAQMLYHASQASGRVAVYAESTLTPQDFEVMATILAHDSTVSIRRDQINVETPYTVQVKVDPQGSYRLDGQVWPFKDAGQILVPPGRHLIIKEEPRFRLVDLSSLGLRLKSFPSELLAGGLTQRGLRLEYAAPTRALALLNKRPYRVFVDGQEFEAKTTYSQGDWSLLLPSGSHQVEIYANSPANFILDVASLFSSSLIVFLGFIVGALLLGLYSAIILRRWIRGPLAWIVRSRAITVRNSK
jgi:uncharacterized protein YdaL